MESFDFNGQLDDDFDFSNSKEIPNNKQSSNPNMRKLNLNLVNKKDAKDYNEEFLMNLENFSESWREKMKRDQR